MAARSAWSGRVWACALVLGLALGGCGSEGQGSEDSSGAAGGDTSQLGDSADLDTASGGDTSSGSDSVGGNDSTSGGDTLPGEDVGEDGGQDTAGGDATVGDTAGSDAGDTATGGDGTTGVDVAPACTSAKDCPSPTSPCGIAVCDGLLGCVELARPDGAVCDDGDACSVASLCKSGACVATAALDCDDSEPCTQDDCDAKVGCSNLPLSATACDDGDACSNGDSCKDGSCVAGINTCACKTTADCAPFDDGDACNGKLFCDVTSATCKVNAATVIVCNGAENTACTVNSCDPKTGTCSKQAKPFATPCDDGLACTTGDHCKDGACTAGTQTCCSKDADCPDDGNLCNGSNFCNLATGSCQLNPLSIVSCSKVNDTECAQTACEPKTGACKQTPAPNGTTCDDGDPCTVPDTCQSGSCSSGKDLCQCQSDADCGALEDGDLCNGTLFCNKQSGKCQLNPKTIVSCQTVEDTACTAATCQPKTGKCEVVAKVDGTPCDADGAACTPKDSCQSGVCKADTNICPCQSDADCATKEDDNLCNGTLYCDKETNACKVNPKTVVFCAEPTGSNAPCLANLCNPKSGLCITLPAHEGSACDADGNPCTAIDTCQKGQCKADANTCECQADADCAAKDDGNVCNGTLFCEKSTKTCVVNPGTVVTCSSVFDTECQQNRCQPKTGACKVESVRELLHCDADGNACTLYDVCQKGQCTPGANVCGCGVDADCGKFDDDDICNGKLLCGQVGSLKECQVNKATVVTCKPGDPASCTTQTCDPTTGSCGVAPWPDGKPCTDDDPCTEATTCAKGSCKGGTAKACDDGNLCTDDSCKAGNGCVGLPNAATCVDGNACTAQDACSKGSCTGTPVTCDDGNPCTQDSCDGKDGCVFITQAGACDDGDACTTGDTCKTGVCKGTAASCNDNNACTTDTCDSSKGCASVPVVSTKPVSCDDGNACTAQDACQDGKCVGSAVVCDDGKACTQDSCDAKAGCVHAAYATPCDDGDACTVGDSCKSGECKGTPLIGVGGNACDDNNPCTVDTCDGAKGCVSVATTNPVGCDDGDACTKGDTCNKGSCSGTPATCNDNNACTQDNCDGKVGCVFVAQAGACDDGDACTTVDTCKSGACKGTPLVGVGGNACDDNNPCTKDTCDSAKGCVSTPVSASDAVPCDDGDACTGKDTCDGATCKGAATTCNDNDVCTTDGCDASSGECTHQAKSCDDNNPCTNDGCHKTLGCLAVYSTATCDDGDACTTGDVCQSGKCVSKGVTFCNDGDPCTADSCDKAKGCTFTATSGAACDDGIACTSKDTCDAGVCKGTILCNDGNSCTDDACDPKTGKCTTIPKPGSCDDSNACTENESCQDGACKPEKVKVCDDGNVCSDDSCDSVKGCLALANTKPCSLGACTTGDTCADKSCKPGSGQRIFNKAVVASGTGEMPYDMLLLDNGDIMVAGGRASPGPYGAYSYNHVGRILADGSGAAWWTGLSSYSGSWARRLLRRASGTIAVLMKPGQCLALTTITEGGSPGAIAFVAVANCNSAGQANGGQQGAALRERILDGKAERIVFGTREEYGNGEFVAVINDLGQTTASFMRYVEWQNHYVNDGIVESNGGLAYIGASGEAAGSLGGNDIVFTRLDKNLKQVGRWHYGGGGHDLGTSLVEVGDGGFYLAGGVVGVGIPNPWFARVDGAGKPLWAKSENFGAWGAATQILLAPDGQLLALAKLESQPGTYAESRMLALSASGLLLWSRTYGVPSRVNPLTAMRLAPNGDILAVGWDQASNNDMAGGDVRLVHADRWGFSTCTAAGACAAVSQKGCSDGDVCTADWCDATAACKSAKHAGLCSDDDACTLIDLCIDDGSCKPGATQLCDDGNPCTTETCDKAKGCVYTTVQDGVTCGSGKTCSAGVCQ